MPNSVMITKASVDKQKIPAAGGTVKVTFSARTLEKSEDAQVTYKVVSGPYRSTPGQVAKKIERTATEISQRVELKKTAGTPNGMIELQIEVRIPDDSTTRTVFIWIDEPVGKQLKAYREEKQLTQEELAELLDRSRSRISAIENDATPPSDLEAAIAEVIRRG